MDRLIAPNSVVQAGADIAPTTGTPQFATDGNPAASIPPTQWPAYQYNAIQEELIAIIGFDGTLPDRTNNAQVLAAIQRMYPAYVKSGTLTLYMSPTGSDTNTGLSGAQALLTFQGVANVLTKYNLSGVHVVINLAAGSYAGFNWSGGITPCQSIGINGAGSASTTIVGTGGTFGASNANCVAANFGANISISGVTLTATGTGGDYTTQGVCVNAGLGGNIVIGTDVVFGSTGFTHILTASGGQVQSLGLGSNQGAGYTIKGGGQYHIYGEVGGIVTVADSPIEFVGTPAFSGAFIQGSFHAYTGYWNNTFTGSFTGTRYELSNYSVLNTAGASSTYLPGTGAGSATNALYV